MWTVVTVETFDSWFLALSEHEQTDVLAYIKLLEIKGANLGRPYVDTVKGANHIKHLKELRVQHKGTPYRVFFAFDPKRQAVLLCGGDKTGNKRFYKKMIPIAEKAFLQYLSESSNEARHGKTFI